MKRLLSITLEKRLGGKDRLITSFDQKNIAGEKSDEIEGLSCPFLSINLYS